MVRSETLLRARTYLWQIPARLGLCLVATMTTITCQVLDAARSGVQGVLTILEYEEHGSESKFQSNTDGLGMIKYWYPVPSSSINRNTMPRLANTRRPLSLTFLLYSFPTPWLSIKTELDLGEDRGHFILHLDPAASNYRLEHVTHAIFTMRTIKSSQSMDWESSGNDVMDIDITCNKGSRSPSPLQVLSPLLPPRAAGKMMSHKDSVSPGQGKRKRGLEKSRSRKRKPSRANDWVEKECI